MDKFRFPLPKFNLEDEVSDETEEEVDQEILKIGERVYNLSVRLGASTSAVGENQQKKVADLVKKTTEESEEIGQLSSKMVSSLNDPDYSYISHGSQGPEASKIRALLLNPEKEKELDSAAVGAKKADLSPKPGKKKLKKLKKLERERTKGGGWFDMKAPEMTEELKRDLEIIQMRSALDPKRFYKKPDSELPKYFQIGQIQDNAADFYNDRIPKKERKKTLVDELMSDAEFRKYNKRKYAEIQEEQQRNNRRYASKIKKKKFKALKMAASSSAATAGTE